VFLSRRYRRHLFFGDFRKIFHPCIPHHASARPEGFQLRIDSRADLLHHERDGDHQQENQGSQAEGDYPASHPSFRKKPQQRYRCQQSEPGELWGAGFMVGEAQSRQGQETPAPVPQSEYRQSNDEHQKEVEERPLFKPGSRDDIHPARTQEAPARRQVEHRRNRLKVMIPADRGHYPRRGFVAGFGHQVEVPFAEFHACLLVRTLAGDELVGAIHRHPPEEPWGVHSQVPVTAHGALDPVLDGKAGPGKIQPPGPPEVEHIRRGLGIPTADFLKRQQRTGRHYIGGQVMPSLRCVCLFRIHPGNPFKLHHPQ